LEDKKILLKILRARGKINKDKLKKPKRLRRCRMRKGLLLILFLSLLISPSAYAPVYIIDKMHLEEWEKKKDQKKKKKSSPSYYNKRTTKDGLKLEEFVVSRGILGEDGSIMTCDGSIKVGDVVIVIIKLKNTKKKPLVFKKYGIFVGCRWERKKRDLVNRDFGYCRNVVIKPGKSIFLTARIKVDKPGTWYFWPAYWLNDHFGPYMWKVKKIKVNP
jgi:hypothetical protein